MRRLRVHPYSWSVHFLIDAAMNPSDNNAPSLSLCSTGGRLIKPERKIIGAIVQNIINELTHSLTEQIGQRGGLRKPLWVHGI